jgi:hypothetical protein
VLEEMPEAGHFFRGRKSRVGGWILTSKVR